MTRVIAVADEQCGYDVLLEKQALEAEYAREEEARDAWEEENYGELLDLYVDCMIEMEHGPREIWENDDAGFRDWLDEEWKEMRSEYGF